MQPQSNLADTTIAAGIRIRTLELGWDAYETANGTFSASYISTQQAKLAAMRAAGADVILDLGLQYPPAWATAIRPFVDQAGNISSTFANSIWSSTVRSAIAVYIARVFSDLGTNFLAVRLGSGSSAETLYPANSGATKSYWAFDSDAQAASPVPGWKPGDASPAGQATTFWTWYVGQLVSTVNYLQTQIRLAYSGPIQQLMPGQGVRPEQVAQLISSNLTDAAVLASERGAAWDTVIAGITNKANVVVYCSSLADGSGTNEASSDRRLWSAAHWIASNADVYGMSKAGENPGQNNYATMQTAFSQATTYGYSPMMWAFESQLYGGVYATLYQYATLIRGT